LCSGTQDQIDDRIGSERVEVPRPIAQMLPVADDGPAVKRFDRGHAAVEDGHRVTEPIEFDRHLPTDESAAADQLPPIKRRACRHTIPSVVARQPSTSYLRPGVFPGTAP
jgi:hypothetical protein